MATPRSDGISLSWHCPARSLFRGCCLTEVILCLGIVGKHPPSILAHIQYNQIVRTWRGSPVEWKKSGANVCRSRRLLFRESNNITLGGILGLRTLFMKEQQFVDDDDHGKHRHGNCWLDVIGLPYALIIVAVIVGIVTRQHIQTRATVQEKEKPADENERRGKNIGSALNQLDRNGRENIWTYSGFS